MVREETERKQREKSKEERDLCDESMEEWLDRMALGKKDRIKSKGEGPIYGVVNLDDDEADAMKLSL